MQNDDKKMNTDQVTSKEIKGLRTYQSDIKQASVLKTPPKKIKKDDDKQEKNIVVKPKESIVSVPPTPNPPKFETTGSERRKEKIAESIDFTTKKANKEQIAGITNYITPNEVSIAEKLREEKKREEELNKKIEEEKQEKEILEKKEEIKKKEEERKRNEEKIREEEKRLEEDLRKILIEKSELSKRLSSLNVREESIKQEKESILNKKSGIEEALGPVLNKEEAIEEKIANMEKQESSAPTPKERHNLEQKRWLEEQQRRDVEKEKWEKEKEIESININIEKKDILISGLDDKINKTKERIEEIGKEQQEKELNQKLKGLSKIKDGIEVQWIELNDKKKELEEALLPVVEKVKEIEVLKQSIEVKEHSEISSYEQRKIEQRRWDIEDKQRKIAQQRWDIEGKIKEVSSKIDTLRPKYQFALKEEEEVQMKLDNINT